MLIWFYGLVVAGIIVGGVALGLYAQGRLLLSDAWVVLVTVLIAVAGMTPFAVRHGRAKKG